VPAWFVEREALAEEGVARSPSNANDRPGIALIGCRGMGRVDARDAGRFGDILALCDVDQNHLDAATQEFKKDGKTPTRYTDFRKVMERDDIDVIVQATPDHWHTLINLAAARAG
jgi:predicted dehydrogenase